MWDSANNEVISWDDYFFSLLPLIAQKSKDPNTKIGCIIIGEGHEIKTTGYNSFPRGLNDNVPARSKRPEKYNWIIHAEQNAICNASRNGVSLLNSIMYLHGLPCMSCACSIVQAGIKEIVYKGSEVSTSKKYIKEVKKSQTLLKECGVKIRNVEYPF